MTTQMKVKAYQHANELFEESDKSMSEMVFKKWNTA